MKFLSKEFRIRSESTELTHFIVLKKLKIHYIFCQDFFPPFSLKVTRKLILIKISFHLSSIAVCFINSTYNKFCQMVISCNVELKMSVVHKTFKI